MNGADSTPVRPARRGVNALLTIVLATVALSATTGCVRRTLSVTSEPSGALVHLNDREVGRTPVDVEFLWYGDYDLRVSLEGYEPIVTSATVSAPLWDTLPLDLAAELSPGVHRVERQVHIVLERSVIDDEGLVERARRMQRETVRDQADPRANGEPDGEPDGKPDGKPDGEPSAAP